MKKWLIGGAAAIVCIVAACILGESSCFALSSSPG